MEARLLVLAALSGEHALFLGPPGTAKSALGRRLSMVVGGAFFERLLTRFSVPEELFGPLSLKALDQDEYRRQIEGYLPTARVAFIDEIFKANSSILNALLTILNERAFDNGRERLHVPLACLVAASNELPEEDELDALYDRFLIRRAVGPLTDDGLTEFLTGASNAQSGSAGGPLNDSSASNDAKPADALPSLFGAPSDAPPNAILSPSLPSSSSPFSSSPTLPLPSEPLGSTPHDPLDESPSPPPPPPPALAPEELEAARREALRSVLLPPEVVQIVVDARRYLRDEADPPASVSDRRLGKAAKMLKVAAWANGRDRVLPTDALLLAHVLWSDPAQHEPLKEWLLGRVAADDAIAKERFLISSLFRRACKLTAQGGRNAKDEDDGSDKATKDGPRPTVSASSSSRTAQQEELLADARHLEALASTRLSDALRSLRHTERAIRSDLFTAPQEADRTATALVPRLEAAAESAEALLEEAVTLRASLEDGPDASHLAELLPRLWADFIRNADVAELRPLGTRTVAAKKTLYRDAA